MGSSYHSPGSEDQGTCDSRGNAQPEPDAAADAQAEIGDQRNAASAYAGPRRCA
jgi:hypothetical protein